MTAPLHSEPPAAPALRVVLVEDSAMLRGMLCEMLAELEAIRKAAPDLFRKMDESGLFTAEIEEKLARAFAAGYQENRT